MVKSKNKVDKQLFNQLLIQQYHRTGLPFGTLADRQDNENTHIAEDTVKSKQDQKSDMVA